MEPKATWQGVIATQKLPRRKPSRPKSSRLEVFASDKQKMNTKHVNVQSLQIRVMRTVRRSKKIEEWLPFRHRVEVISELPQAGVQRKLSLRLPA